MAKRLTDSEKYNDAWFINLGRNEKLLFYYLIDNVDNAGFYELSFKHLQFHLDFSRDEILGAIKGLARGLLGADLEIKNGDRIYLKNFLEHQKMLPLNPYNSYHINALRSFEVNCDFVYKDPFLSEIKISGAKKKNGKVVEKTDTTLLKYLKKNQGLPSPIVEVEVEVEVKEKVEVEVKVENKNVENCFEKCLLHFPQHLHPNKNQKTKWLETIEKLNRIDKIQFEKIIEIVKKTRQDQFWSKNFLSLVKLRKKNPDGIMYAVVFNENIKSNNGQTNNTTGIYSEDFKKRIAGGLVSQDD